MTNVAKEKETIQLAFECFEIVICHNLSTSDTFELCVAAQLPLIFSRTSTPEKTTYSSSPELVQVESNAIHAIINPLLCTERKALEPQSNYSQVKRSNLSAKIHSTIFNVQCLDCLAKHTQHILKTDV